MKVIIQCAASKVPDAGSLVTQGGRPVRFVAQPGDAPDREEWLFARPDDPSDRPGQSWRQRLVTYNCAHDNPLGLLKAYRLYKHPIYKELVTSLGADNVLILSAGWGLVRADYLLPIYDITFKRTKPNEDYRCRRLQDKFHDFCHLQGNEKGPVVFFSGKDYFPLLWELTAPLTCDKVLFYASARPPDEVQGWRAKRFERNHTNWQYTCAREFLEGKLSI